MTEATRPEPGTPNRESVLGNLKAKREEIKSKSTIDLAVPRWEGEEPQIFVRYKPVDHSVIRAAQQATEKANDKRKAEAEMKANMRVLAEGCVGVYGKLKDDDTKYSLRENDPRGEWTGFDPDLAAALGVEEESVSAVILALYMFDGDILATAARIGEFSGYREIKAEEAVEGE